MRTLFIPSTPAGRWAALLLLLFIPLLFVKTNDIAPFNAISIVAVGAMGLLAALLALAAVVRGRERSLWAFLAIALGLLIVVWTVGELLGPH